ncbi:hypothetical protein D7V93_22665, partial [Corallococcus llansteffanensis]
MEGVRVAGPEVVDALLVVDGPRPLLDLALERVDGVAAFLHHLVLHLNDRVLHLGGRVLHVANKVLALLHDLVLHLDGLVLHVAHEVLAHVAGLAQPT